MAVAKSVRFCMLQNMYRCVFIWLSLTALFSSVSGMRFSIIGATDFGIPTNKS